MALIIETIQKISLLKVSLTLEKKAQQQIFEKIEKLGYEKEHHLDEKNIPDFFHPGQGIAIEVKIKGSKKSIYKQCLRYAGFDNVKVILLCSNKNIGLPRLINGKPVYFLHLGKAWL